LNTTTASALKWPLQPSPNYLRLSIILNAKLDFRDRYGLTQMNNSVLIFQPATLTARYEEGGDRFPSSHRRSKIEILYPFPGKLFSPRKATRWSSCNSFYDQYTSTHFRDCYFIPIYLIFLTYPTQKNTIRAAIHPSVQQPLTLKPFSSRYP
jgi:hypothetical protein